jgi:hypothetical protein
MFTLLFSGVKDMVSGWFSLKKQQYATQQAAEVTRQTQQSNMNSWELAEIANSDKWLRRILFTIVVWPIVYCNFNPMQVHIYFEQLCAAVPGWWISLFVLVFSAVFGISPARNLILSIIAQFKK